jgi:hypothetical protein
MHIRIQKQIFFILSYFEESHKLQVYTNILPRKISEPKKYDIHEQFRILHSEEHHLALLGYWNLENLDGLGVYLGTRT